MKSVKRTKDAPRWAEDGDTLFWQIEDGILTPHRHLAPSILLPKRLAQAVNAARHMLSKDTRNQDLREDALVPKATWLVEVRGRSTRRRRQRKAMQQLLGSKAQASREIARRLGIGDVD